MSVAQMEGTLGQSLALLSRYLWPRKRQVALLLGLLLGSIGFQLASPQALRTFLDQAEAGAAARTMVNTAVLFFMLVLSQKILSLVSVYVGEDLGWDATNQLRVDLAAHVLRLDMGFHKLRPPGELISRIDGDVGTLAETFSKLVVHVLGNGLLVLGILALMFREDWRFGLIGLGYGLVTLLFLRLIQKPQTAVSARIRQGYADSASYVEERLTATEDIRANGAGSAVLANFYPILARINADRVTSTLLGGATFSAGYMLYVLAWVGTLGLAGWLYLRGEITIGVVYLMAFYVGLLESPLKYIRRQIVNMQRAMASIGHIRDLLLRQPQVTERATAVLPTRAPSVRFESVTFTYKDKLVSREPLSVSRKDGIRNTDYGTRITAVLHNVSFQLEAGKTLGLLGRTGSGKTTLTRLLFRLYDVDAGKIALGRVDVRDVALADLRQHVGMVTQDVQLFAATIRDNLTLFRNYQPGRAPISDAAIYDALTTLGLDEWLESLPHGLDTQLQSGGQGLSAGEGQLLALARVFLRDPQLVILDEASSRLDPVTEQRLERAIDRLLAGRTGIVIAHRLATVQRADDILILENGRIAEHGPRTALAANPESRFAALLRTGMAEVLA